MSVVEPKWIIPTSASFKTLLALGRILEGIVILLYERNGWCMPQAEWSLVDCCTGGLHGTCRASRIYWVHWLWSRHVAFLDWVDDVFSCNRRRLALMWPLNRGNPISAWISSPNTTLNGIFYGIIFFDCPFISLHANRLCSMQTSYWGILTPYWDQAFATVYKKLRVDWNSHTEYDCPSQTILSGDTHRLE